MGATGQGETQTAKTARNGERQKQAQAATGGGQAAKSTKEVPRQRKITLTPNMTLQGRILAGLHREALFIHHFYGE